MYVENRQKDPDPHGRPADELVVFQSGHLGDLAVGRRDHQPRLLRHASRRVAEEVNHQSQQGARHNGQIPDGRQGQNDRQRQQRPAHQLQLGQSPSGQRQLLPPAKRIMLLRPITRAEIANVFQVPRVEDLVRGPGRVALPQVGHALHISPPKPLQPPPTPPPPGHFQPVTDRSARLRTDKIGRQRLDFGSIR